MTFHVGDDDDTEGDHSSTDQPEGRLDVLKALDHIGTGPFHWIAVSALGLANASDAVEVLCIGFILPEVDRDWGVSGPQQGVLSAAVFAGMLLGGLCGGSISDTFGRRTALAASLTINAVFALLAAFSPSWPLLSLCRAVAGIGVGASVPPVFSLTSELLPSTARGFWLSIIAWAWTLGMVATAGLAWVTIGWIGASWRVFAALAAAPSITALVLLLLFVPESPRFLNLKGRYAEARAVLLRISWWNRRRGASGADTQIPGLHALAEQGHGHQAAQGRAAGPRDCVTATTEPASGAGAAADIEGAPAAAGSAAAVAEAAATSGFDGLAAAREVAAAHARGQIGTGPSAQPEQRRPGHPLCSRASLADARAGLASTLANSRRRTAGLFVRGLRRPTIVMLCVWFVLSLAWYGLGVWMPTLFKSAGVEVSLYADAFITAAANIPGNVAASLLLDRMQRKYLLVVSLLLTMGCTLALAFLRSEGLVLAASCMMNAVSVTAWNAVNVLSTEAFPTAARSSAMGILSATGRFGSIVGQLLFGGLMSVSVPALLSSVSALLLLGAVAGLLFPATAPGSSGAPAGRRPSTASADEAARGVDGEGTAESDGVSLLPHPHQIGSSVPEKTSASLHPSPRGGGFSGSRVNGVALSIRDPEALPLLHAGTRIPTPTASSASAGTADRRSPHEPAFGSSAAGPTAL
jgi:VNT family MFS transporter (synaptic vesicle glycoprotein 2)